MAAVAGKTDRQEAEERAEALLLSDLTDEQKAQYLSHPNDWPAGIRYPYITVTGSEGNKYCILKKLASNVLLFDHLSRHDQMGYCLTPDEADFPLADLMFIIKKMIEWNEGIFKARAQPFFFQNNSNMSWETAVEGSGNGYPIQDGYAQQSLRSGLSRVCRSTSQYYNLLHLANHLAGIGAMTYEDALSALTTLIQGDNYNACQWLSQHMPQLNYGELLNILTGDAEYRSGNPDATDIQWVDPDLAQIAGDRSRYSFILENTRTGERRVVEPTNIELRMAENGGNCVSFTFDGTELSNGDTVHISYTVGFDGVVVNQRVDLTDMNDGIPR